MKYTKTVRAAALLTTVVTVGALAAGCSSGSTTSSSGAQAGSGTGTITIWAHSGQTSENTALQAVVDSFNASQSEVTAELVLQPESTYTTTIQNTPTDSLPDVMELDGPTLASYVYNGKVSPISDFVSSTTIDNATSGSTEEGTYDGQLYALAVYDSALGLYANKSLLEKAGVTIPTSYETAWTADEFSTVLAKLAAVSSSGKSLDIQEQNGLASEWGTYAFSPLIQSAGGNLINGNTAEGTLDSTASVTALTEFQSWKTYVDANSDGNAFTSGRVALSWGGHWNYPAYSAALGDDLVALPLPNMGEGSKTGAGSWTWGISSGSKNGTAAGKFIDYLLSDSSVSSITSANGAPAATQSVFSATSLYQSGGALSLWGEALNNASPASDITSTSIAILRPITPGYPVITSAFSNALSAIWNGADVQSTLTTAAQTIDQQYSSNDDYQ